MSDNNEKASRVGRVWIVWIALVAIVLAACSAAAWYLSSDRFNSWVRSRIVQQIEEATGGRVEIGKIDWKLTSLSFELRDLTIHGTEAPDQAPYIRVQRVNGRGKIISLFRREVGLGYIELSQPVIHIIIYPNGSTNQPTPRIRRDIGKGVETLFELAINEARVENGILVVNDRPIPFNFTGRDVAAEVKYEPSAKRYDGTLRLGRLETNVRDLKRISASLDSQFSLFPNHLEIKSLQVITGKSRLNGSGTVKDFADPTADVTYTFSVDLPETGAIFGVREIRGGTLNAKGAATLSSSNIVSAGKVNVQGFSWEQRGLALRNAAAGAIFSINNKDLRLEHIFASLLGGTATGSGVVENWTSVADRPRASMKRVNRRAGEATSRPQTGLFKLHLNDIAVPAITSAISTRTFPLVHMKLAGRVDGSTTLSWKGSPQAAVADVTARVTPPQSPAPAQVPVSGTALGRYRVAGRRIEVESADLSTPASHIQASGLFGLAIADLRLTATTTDLGEIRPILVSERGATEIPIDLHGQALFNGTVTGKMSGLSVAGQLRITNFDWLISTPTSDLQDAKGAGSAGQVSTAVRTKRMRWDVLSGDIQYSPDVVVFRNALLTRGAAKISFDVTAQLKKYSFLETAPFTARVSMQRAELSDLQSLAGYSYPVSGTVDVTMLVSGTERDTRGSGHAQITNATIYGQPMSRASSAITFANHELQLTNVEVQQKQARVSGKAGYNLLSRAYQFNLRGTDFNLASLKALQTSRLQTAGQMDFVAEGSGTPEAPSLNADVFVTKLMVNGDRVGDVAAHARTIGDTMRVEARSNVAASDLHLEGTVRMRDEFRTTAALRLTHVDLDPILRAYTKGRLTGHSAFAGSVDISGPLRQPKDLDVKGEITEFYIPVESIHVRNEGPIRFSMAQQVFNLQQLHLVAEDTNLTASGTTNLGADGRMSMRAEGRVNLKLVQSLNPDYVSYGLVSMNVRIGGTTSDPRINGQLQVANAGISYIDLPNGLSDINGNLVFNRDRLQIQNLTARTGGGTLNLAGYITYSGTIGFNIDATAKDFRLRYPPGISSMADAKLRLSGTLQNSLLSGDVTLTRFGLNPQFDFANYVARAKQPPELPKPDSPLNNLKLDVHVVSTPELQVQTSLARLSGNVDLRLRGTAAKPAVLGRVDIVEGDIYFNGTKYRLERGGITFTNPTRIEPYLDVQASTHVRDYDIALGFHGSVYKLSTTYRSDPPLGTADIIALLAFGRTREETAMQPVSNQNFTETASNAILGQALNATVSSRVQKLFGVSRIKIDPQVGGAENNPSGARVMIEQQVKNDLTITYITDVARTNQQVISVEYNVTRAVSILAVRDQNGIVSFDVRIRHRKR